MPSTTNDNALTSVVPSCKPNPVRIVISNVQSEVVTRVKLTVG